MINKINIPSSDNEVKISKITWNKKTITLKSGFRTGLKADEIWESIQEYMELFHDGKADNKSIRKFLELSEKYISIITSKEDCEWILDYIDSNYSMGDGIEELITILYVFYLTLSGCTQEEINEFFRKLDEESTNNNKETDN